MSCPPTRWIALLAFAFSLPWRRRTRRVRRIWRFALRYRTIYCATAHTNHGGVCTFPVSQTFPTPMREICESEVKKAFAIRLWNAAGLRLAKRIRASSSAVFRMTITDVGARGDA